MHVMFYLWQISKSLNKKKDNVMYSFRQSMPLYGMMVFIFETPCTYYVGYLSTVAVVMILQIISPFQCAAFHILIYLN